MSAPARPLALVVAQGLEPGRRFLPGGAAVHIGRDAGNHLVLPDAGVSRRHAILSRAGCGWRLADCGSSNGTTLNGVPLEAPAPVRDGDRIGLGPVVLLVAEEVPARRASSPVAPPAARRWGGLGGRRGGLIFAGAGASALVAAGWMCLFARRAPPAARGARPPAVGEAAAGRSVGRGPVDGERRAVALGDPTAARAAYERGRRKLDERRVAPRNLYDAWSDFSSARALLGAQGPRPPLLADLDETIAALEADLRKECARLLFSGARQARYDEAEKAQRAWREVLQRFPGDDPWGCRKRAHESLLESQGAGAGPP